MPWLNLNGKLFQVDQLLHADVEKLNPFERTTLDFCQAWISGQTEFMLQTSGSTGEPKHILLKRSQMEASARQTIAELQIQKGTTSLICLDTKYIAGKMMLVRSLMAEMNIMAVDPSSDPLDKIEDQLIDFVALVPYQLEHILQHTPEKLDQVRCAIIGGAAISHSLKEKIKKNTCAIYATFGMTETLSHIALQRLNGTHPQEYFEAFPNVDLQLDTRGCLCIKTNYLAEEIVTNDLVELLDKRKFKWLGRIDNIINSGGIKIIPEKVESVFERILDSLQIKNRFFITGLPDEKLGNKVTILFEGSFPQEINQRILIEAGQRLTKYEVPKEILFIPQFKKTATGKINRTATLTLL